MIDYIMRIIFGMDLVLYTQSKNKNIIVMIARILYVRNARTKKFIKSIQ